MVTELSTNFNSINDSTGRTSEQGLIGVEVCEGNASGDWDASSNPLDEPPGSSPPGLYPQDRYPNTLLYVSFEDDTFWHLPLSRILSAENGSQVRGKVSFAWNFKSNGDFLAPTGSSSVQE